MVGRWSDAWEQWGSPSREAAHCDSRGVGHPRSIPGHWGRGGNSTGRSPFSPRRAGPARHRHPLGSRLPRGHSPLQRWLRRYRSLLRNLGVRHHRTAAAGARENRIHVASQLLRAAGAAHHPHGDAGHHRHRHRLVPFDRHAGRTRDRDRRRMVRPLPRQRPLRGHGYQLPPFAGAALATAELLVARRRGAVLHRLPGRRCADGVVGAAGIIPAPSHDFPRRRHRRFLLVLHRVHGVERAERRTSRCWSAPGSWRSGA